MKLKKLNRTAIDRRIRIFFAISFLLFLFSFLVLQPFNQQQKLVNMSLTNEIATLENENNTLRR